ncbi:MAG: HNH endonuclease, partial [Armatimonadota bacterium]
MGNEVLVLNSDYEPLNVCNVRRAICLVYKGKAEVLHEDETVGDGEVVGPTSRFPSTPSVVKLRHHVKRPLPELRVSRRSVFARDNYTCQYCGTMAKDLTIDH